MNYEELAEIIRKHQKAYYEKYGINPTDVIIGEKIFNYLEKKGEVTEETAGIVSQKNVFGLRAAIDKSSPYMIRLGHMEETTNP